ncbi:MAG: TolC family protein [Proteobacteria bacterium]|nr:TolC family protein [Pseudomonadota bacterium]
MLVLLAGAPALAGPETAGDPAAGSPEAGRVSLEQAVRMAREHGYLFRAAGLDRAGALQERRAALADFLPRVTANYSWTDLDEQPIMKSGGMTIPVADLTQYHWDVTVIQPLFTGFGLTSRLRMAGLKARVREMEQRQAELDLVRDAKAAYFQLLLAGKILRVADQAVAALESQEEDSRKFFDQELIPYNELLRSQVALAGARQQREQAAAAHKLAETGLNLLIGQESGAPVFPEDVDSVPESDFDLQAITAQALGGRPLLLAGRLGLETLEKAVTAARSAYYPKVGAFASYEQNGNNPAADENDYSNRYNSAVGIKAEWEVFAWGRTRAEVARVHFDLRAARQRILALEDLVRLEVEQAYRSLLVAVRNVETSLQAREQARENLRITRLQYHEQAATSTDVLNALTFLTQADTDYYQALYGAMTAQAQLDRALGKNPDTETPEE